MRFCDTCGLPIGFVPVWKDGQIFRWKALNPDGSPHYHTSYETNHQVVWQ